MTVAVDGRRLGGRGPLQIGVVGGDGLIERHQLRRGLDAVPLPELAAQALEGAQRLDLAVAAVQGQHQLRPPALAQRLGLDRRPQVGHEAVMLAELEAPLEEVLLGFGLELAQAHGFGHPDRPVGEVGQGLAPPQLEAAGQLGHGRPRMARGQEGTSACAAAFEPAGVDRVLGETEAVAQR